MVCHLLSRYSWETFWFRGLSVRGRLSDAWGLGEDVFLMFFFLNRKLLVFFLANMRWISQCKFFSGISDYKQFSFCDGQKWQDFKHFMSVLPSSFASVPTEKVLGLMFQRFCTTWDVQNLANNGILSLYQQVSWIPEPSTVSPISLLKKTRL